MTNYDDIDFSSLDAFADDEVVTHSPVRDVRLPSGKVLALVTLDNGRDHTRPNTLGPATLIELGERLDELAARECAQAVTMGDASARGSKPFELARRCRMSFRGLIEAAFGETEALLKPLRDLAERELVQVHFDEALQRALVLLRRSCACP